MKYEFILEKTVLSSFVIEAEDIDQADEKMRESLDQVQWPEESRHVQIVDVNEMDNFTHGRR
jgi:hypothetical protein